MLGCRRWQQLTLQHTATQCNTLQHIATTHCNNTLQHTATTHCTTPHHAARHCNTLPHTARPCNLSGPERVGAAACEAAGDGSNRRCNTIQHTATHCNHTLQHTATYCNTLQHITTPAGPSVWVLENVRLQEMAANGNSATVQVKFLKSQLATKSNRQNDQ